MSSNIHENLADRSTDKIDHGEAEADLTPELLGEPGGVGGIFAFLHLRAELAIPVLDDAADY